MERTLGIIKPNSVNNNHIGKILSIGEEAGLKVVEMKMKKLTKEEAGGFMQNTRNAHFIRAWSTS